MTLIILALIAIGLLAFALRWSKRQKDRKEIEQYSISAQTLHSLLESGQIIHVFDVRVPLDFLTDAHIIPGGLRIPPKDILANSALIPSDEDSVFYCTCPSDKTSRSVLESARTMNFFRVRFLRGGLAAWTACGFPVEPYDKPFHLDTPS